MHHGHCWPGDPGVVTLRAIAPTPKDLERMGKVWDRLVGPRPRMRAAIDRWLQEVVSGARPLGDACLLYTSDAADERSSVDLGGRRIIKKKKNYTISVSTVSETKKIE